MSSDDIAQQNAIVDLEQPSVQIPPPSEQTLPSAADTPFEEQPPAKPAPQDDFDERNSTESAGSSTPSAAAHEKANLAELLVKQSRLQRLHQLQRRRQQLEEEWEMHQLETDIEIARARERVYAEDIVAVVRNDTLFAEPSAHNTSVSHLSNMPSSAVSASSSVSPVSSHLASATPVVSTSAASAHSLTSFSVSSTANVAPIMPDALNLKAPDFIPKAHSPSISYSLESALDPLLTALTMPRHELLSFEGDITRYQAFIAGFDLRVGGKHVSDEEKLHILHTYLKGEPRELIGGCFHMHPSAGYNEARRLLAKAYGDLYKLSMA